MVHAPTIQASKFQSSPLLKRGATRGICPAKRISLCFNPHPS